MSKWLKLTDDQGRYVFYWLSAIIGRIVPIIAVGIKYDAFTPEVKWYYKAIILIAFLALWAILKFWHDLVEFARDMQDGLARETVLGIGRLGPYIMLWAAAIAAKVGTQDFLYLSGLLLLCQLCSLGFGAEHKRLKRKILMSRGHVRVIRD